MTSPCLKFIWNPRCWLCDFRPTYQQDLCFPCLRELSEASDTSSALLRFQSVSSRLVRKSRTATPYRSAHLFWRIATKKGWIETWRRKKFSAVYWLPQGEGAISGLELFATRVGNALAIPVHNEFQKISRSPQHQKNRRDRLDTEMLFTLRGRSAPERILLFDDVQTSGTSLLQGKYLLKKAGAKFVTPFPLVMNMMDGFERQSSESKQEGDEMDPFLLQLFM